MSVATRDSRMRNISELASHHTRAIAEGFAEMKKQAQNNPFLREVLDEYREGVKETIISLTAQKDALSNLIEYLDEKRHAEEDEARTEDARADAACIMDEIAKVDVEITRLTSFV